MSSCSGSFQHISPCFSTHSPHTQIVDRLVDLANKLHVPNLETIDRQFENKLTYHIIAHFMSYRVVALASSVLFGRDPHRAALDPW